MKPVWYLCDKKACKDCLNSQTGCKYIDDIRYSLHYGYAPSREELIKNFEDNGKYGYWEKER